MAAMVAGGYCRKSRSKTVRVFIGIVPASLFDRQK
jgi:hypothetical protein